MKHSTWIAVATITVIAVAIRFWRITSLPPGYWFDEAHKPCRLLAARQRQIFVAVARFRQLGLGGGAL
ncbi:MAG: hypothetical protein FJ030_19745 [Chloroflexi bacterium]|nr:hypothetical protein [Chloroflexota bacterium]